MDSKSSQHFGVTDLQIPLEGVSYVLSGWSGQGSLYQALGVIEGPDVIERDWDEKTLRSRANRILLEYVRADLAHWPRTLEEWLPHLPITSRAQTTVSPTPHGRVDWRETSRLFGWPPRNYVTRQREREIADVSVSTLAWTVTALERIVEQAKQAGALDKDMPAFDLPLAVAREALQYTQIPETPPRPDRQDLESLLTLGKPWVDVQLVAAKIVRAETDLTWFALQLLAPEPEFRWRLFHLAVLGHVLMALRAAGATIRWRTPMGAGGVGPNFLARMVDGTIVDVWFEASGSRAYYGLGDSTYQRVMRSVLGSESSIGADIGLYVPSRGHALLLECKFSDRGSYIARNGFHQAAGYALNETDAWQQTWSYVVGPQEKVPAPSHVNAAGAVDDLILGVTSVVWVPDLISAFLAAPLTNEESTLSVSPATET